jgi:hypothetical protein
MPPKSRRLSLLYRVGEDNRITYVSSDWNSFARRNGAPDLLAEAVVGQPLNRFVAGPETRHLYEIILARVRRTRHGILVKFRCDTPSYRRFMELQVSPWTDGQLQFESRLVRGEDREPVPLMGSSVSRSDEFLTICSWCKRISVSSAWVEVEDAVEQLALFHSDRLPNLTHGVCPECKDRVEREVDMSAGPS